MRDRDATRRIYPGLRGLSLDPAKAEVVELLHKGRDRMGYLRYDDETVGALASILLCEPVVTWETILTFHEAAATGRTTA